MFKELKIYESKNFENLDVGSSEYSWFTQLIISQITDYKLYLSYKLFKLSLSLSLTVTHIWIITNGDIITLIILILVKTINNLKFVIGLLNKQSFVFTLSDNTTVYPVSSL